MSKKIERDLCHPSKHDVIQNRLGKDLDLATVFLKIAALLEDNSQLAQLVAEPLDYRIGFTDNLRVSINAVPFPILSPFKLFSRNQFHSDSSNFRNATCGSG